MSLKQQYIEFHNSTIPLFLQPRWLNAMIPNHSWDVALVEDQGEIIAALPYQTKTKYGITAFTSPWMTPPTGPWIKNLPNVVSRKSIGYYHRITSQLLQQLDRAQYKNFRVKSESYPGHAWTWAGYDLYTQYTYRLNLTKSINLFKYFRNSLRTDIRNGSHLEIQSIKDSSEFFAYMENQVGYDYDLLTPEITENLFHLSEHIIALKAIENNQVIACSLFVLDQEKIYYLIGARLKEGPNLGLTMMLWQIIQQYAEQGLTLDFEGSMIRGVEKYFRAFGGTPCATLNPVKMPSWMRWFMK